MAAKGITPAGFDFDGAASGIVDPYAQGRGIAGTGDAGKDCEDCRCSGERAQGGGVKEGHQGNPFVGLNADRVSLTRRQTHALFRLEHAVLVARQRRAVQ
jgi:hypothetical protein